MVHICHAGAGTAISGYGGSIKKEWTIIINKIKRSFNII